MGNIRRNITDISDLRRGDVLVNSVYRGNNLVWQRNVPFKYIAVGNFSQATLTENITNGLVVINSDGSIDKSFVPAATNGGVLCTAQQSDGKILVGGSFTTYNTVSGAGRLIRLNADYTRDTTFVTGTGFTNGQVNKILVQPDGKIICAGTFTSFNGTTTNRIVRLNSDGSRDTTFVIGTGFNATVNDMILDTFTSVTSTALVRINSPGPLINDYTGYPTTAFGPDLTSITADIVLVSDGTGATASLGCDVLINSSQVNGKIALIRRGDCTFIQKIKNAQDAGAIAVIMMDNVEGTSVAMGGQVPDPDPITIPSVIISKADGDVLEAAISSNTINVTLATQSTSVTSSRIVVVGDFTTYNSSARNRIVRLNPNNGSLEATTTFTIGTGFPSNANRIVVDSAGKYIVVGVFSTYNGVSANGAARINSDGTRDTAFVVGSGFGGSAINSLVLGNNGTSDFYDIGGAFTTYKGTTQNRFARILANGDLVTSFAIGTGFNSQVSASVIQSDGKVVVVGPFATYQGVTATRIIRLNTDGTIDTTFVTNAGFNNNLTNNMIILANGKLLVGGSFTTYRSLVASRIMQVSNNLIDNTFNVGSGFNFSVRKIVKQGSQYLLAGAFTSYASVSGRNGLIRLNSDGTFDSTFFLGFDSIADIYQVILLSDGKILVGGSFTTHNAVTIRGVVRLNADGTRDTTFNSGGVGIGTGTNSVRAIAVQSDGKYLVAGNFTTYNGVSVPRLIRLNTDGTLDTTFIGGSTSGGNQGIINEMVIQSDGKILIAGDFISYSSNDCNYFARLNADGTFDSTFDLGTNVGFNNICTSVVIQSDGKILVGGGFNVGPDGNSAGGIERLNANGTVDTTFNSGGSGFSTAINTIKVLPDNDILVCTLATVTPWNTTYNGSNIPFGVVKLKSDGSLDTSITFPYTLIPVLDVLVV